MPISQQDTRVERTHARARASTWRASPHARRLPIGAEPIAGGGVHFRVWASKRRRASIILETGPGAPAEIELADDENGYFAGTAPRAAAGTCYRYRLDGGPPLPDPASRFQPDGPHGHSQVVDAAAFHWTDQAWSGLTLRGQVIYEMHIGTFTREGTWAAAQRQVEALAELGITAIEVMPVAEFPGRFGWGYDGVALFAPFHHYGSPDDFRRFVDRAHACGIGVVLDVVYNHYGPDGCYLGEFADEYFCADRQSGWGSTPCFDGPQSASVREFFVANGAYWIDEFHLDGLRLDATQNIYDASDCHILAELGRGVRAAAPGRRVLIISEDETQRAVLVRPPEHGGYGLDMVWNDDWHHAALVALLAQDEAYFTDYRGSAQEFVSAAKYGFLYQGQWYRWQYQRRGTPALDLDPARFVHFLANHDQVANSKSGMLPQHLASPGRWRALTALLLLGPQTPMLFQGQEFAASAPFFFFADHRAELASLVDCGRRESLGEFATLALPEIRAALPAPHDVATFESCKLDHDERARPGHREALLLHRDLLRLRREDPCFSAQQRGSVDGAVLGAEALALRFFGAAGDDRLLIINLGRTLHLAQAPEPLLAPPASSRWRVLWSSQDPRYGGIGVLAPEAAEMDRRVPNREQPRPSENWRIQGETAFVLVAEAMASMSP